jgi:integrase
MASIGNDPGGRKRILFFARDGKRRPVRLGKVSQHQAETARGHIENLVSATFSRQACPDETSRWVAGLPDLWRKRLEKVGLLTPREPTPEPKPEPKLTLGKFLADYMAARVDVKPATRVALGQTVKYLTAFFGADKPIEAITAGDALDWCAYLKGKLQLADNTIRRRSGAAKQIFKMAVLKRLLVENPFAGLKAAVRGNPSREHFISRAVAQKVLDGCPDAEWRLIFALCRFGGLRCPSEVLALTWTDIHWDTERFTVHSPKTEHHPGHESRQVPLFPELLPYLLEARELAALGEENVITRYRLPNQNLQTKLRRILKKAGIAAWPKLYQNLRSTRQTELAAEHPIHVVCKWLGNSRAVALEHYLQVTDEDFRKAAQKAAQTPTATPCPTLTPDGGQEEETASVATGQQVSVGDSDISQGEWAILDLNQ